MLEQIKQAVDVFDALDIEKKVLLTKSDQLYKQLDKLRMTRYNLQCRLDTVLGKGEEVADLLDNIRETNIAIKETEKKYEESRKKYSRTWPQADLAKKKVEKLKKKFWKQEGLDL